MAKLTQGTMLYFNHPVDGVVVVGCATSITGITAAREQIETTCLDSEARLYEPGMPNPGTANFTLNFDPADNSHVKIHDLYRAGTKVDWAVGWSDGTSVPTLDSSSEFDLPADRSWILFNGYISDVPFDFALNAVVTSTVAIQLSDFPELIEKTAS